LLICFGKHFEGTTFINYAAVKRLINPGGAVDQMLAGNLQSTLKMTVQGVHDYGFNANLLPRVFERHGATRLKNYAYRDDSLLYWRALRQWVSGYLALCGYTADSDVSKDSALQNWCADLVSSQGGRVVDFGPIQTLESLIDSLTMILFTSSVQHAALNFPQYDLMSYCPNMQLAAYSQFPPSAPGTLGFQQYLEMLPPMGRAKLQLAVGFLLGSVRYTELNEYREHYFSQEVARGPLARFQNDLLGIKADIQNANRARRAYNTLMPSLIPQSINI
jgi:arachidonate 15-lipoxygenase